LKLAVGRIFFRRYAFKILILCNHSGGFMGGSRGSGPPGSQFRLCIIFWSKFENAKNINIQDEKFNGTLPEKIPKSVTVSN